jgi:predicted dehydrogenase
LALLGESSCLTYLIYLHLLTYGPLSCGSVTQVVHIPTLNFLSHLFQITYLCDVSNDALNHSQRKVAGGRLPKITCSPEELCAAPEVDLVMVANNDTFHMPHTLLGLQNNKPVFVEKPIALTLQDADRIIEAEKASNGGKVFVGYMRRYASAFVDALKEVGSIEKIRYARVRDIIGDNSLFVNQSGTFPQTFRDFKPEDSALLAQNTKHNIEYALGEELGIPVTKSTSLTWELLSSLGSHDLSAMRELLGMPEKVLGASLVSTTGSPFWS